MQHIDLSPYIERVFGYAVRRTFTREEAEELTQEILVTTLQELPRWVSWPKTPPAWATTPPAAAKATSSGSTA